MDKICDLMREELWGKYVKEILIISNLHPKMLKKGTLDKPEDVIKYIPSPELDIAYEHSLLTTSIPINIIRKILSETSENGIDKDNMIERAIEDALDFTFQGNVGVRGTRTYAEGPIIQSFDYIAKPLVKLLSTPVAGTAFIPFPRFLYNALKFQIEYSP